MDSGLSASDIALLGNNDGMGGNAFFWIFALLILANGGIGGFGNNRYMDSAFNTFATASSQNEILLGQKFDALGQKINSIGDGICSSTYALNNAINGVQTTLGGAIVDEGRAIQTQLCAINSNIDNKFAQMEKSALEQKIAEQTQAINQLQMAQMFCGVPKINPYGYGVYPYTNGCGCNNNNY